MRDPRGYHIKKVFLISCDKCNENIITRTLTGGEPETLPDVRTAIDEHEATFHP